MSTAQHPDPQTASTFPPCPAWCDREYCEVTQSDVNHASAPVQIETCDARFELSLVRADEFDFPRGRDDEAPELSLRVEPTSVVAPDARVYLRLGDLSEVIEALTAQLYRARLLSAYARASARLAA